MHHLKDPEIRNKIYATNLQRYNVTNPGASPEIESRRIQTNQSRYGVANPMENSSIIEKSIRGRFHISRSIFPENTKRKAINSWNRHYRNFDEYNNKDISYVEDTIVYPWESYQKVIDMFCPKKIISSDDCSMYMIYRRVATSFLNKYDIYHSDPRSELCIGLLYQDKLVQVMTIGKCNSLDYTYQIYRICTRPGFQIENGIKKMFKYAIEDFEVNNIVIYHDARFSNELESIGMIKDGTIEPQKIWYHHDLMIPDDQIFEKELRKLFGETSDPKDEVLQSHGWKSINIEPFNIYSYKSYNI